MNRSTVPFWRTELGSPEADAVRQAVLSGHLSMGELTQEFEHRFAAVLGVPYAVATTSGSAALYLAAAAAGVGPGDEVVLPNRTFVATAHAVLLAGGRVSLVDTHPRDTLIDEAAIAARLTPRTKAVLPVHLNGVGADMPAINALARQRGLRVIEDACQAFYSRSPGGFLGAQSDLGCFSLGVTKLITTGQGGVVVTRDPGLHERLRLLRTHGVPDVFDATYQRFGFNLKFTDLQAAIGLAQLDRLEAKRAAHWRLWRFYESALRDLDYLELLPASEEKGEIPLWPEVLVSERDRVRELLAERGIRARPFLPDLCDSAHLGHDPAAFPNSRKFARHGLFLPGGPDLPQAAAQQTVEALREIRGLLRDRSRPWRAAA